MTQKKVLVIGLGDSGKAACEYLLGLGYSVTGVDSAWEREDLRSLPTMTIGPDRAAYCLEEYAYIVVSPGISQKHPLYVEALKRGIPIFGDTQLIMQKLAQPCIGITGTKGKTTLTLFVEHLLQTASVSACAVGNVGYPFARYVLDKGFSSNEVLVCELSSYQLETLTAKTLDIGVILQITPDHMDRYDTFEHYAETKLKMAHCIKPEGLLIVHSEVALAFSSQLESCLGNVITIPSLFTNPCEDSYLQLTKNREYCDFLGPCLEKMLGVEVLYVAKTIADRLSIKKEHLLEAINTFTKPSHRLEWVADIETIRFVNDSKATNVESVIYAVKALRGDLLLIVGGRDKNLDFGPWKKSFANRVRKLFIIGEAATKIYNVMHEACDVELCKDLEEATRKAFFSAKKQESIVLSPGCASFDHYKNYAHRGESFKEIVQALKKECSR